MAKKWRVLSAEEQIAQREAYLASRKKNLGEQPYQYEAILKAVKAAVEAGDVAPGTLAQIANMTEGPRPEIMANSSRHAVRIRTWLAKTWPLDKWRVYCISTPDVWKGREIWVEFWGTAENMRQKNRWNAEVAAEEHGPIRGAPLNKYVLQRTHRWPT